MSTFDLDSTQPPALVWWRDSPADGWLRLHHLCGGHAHERLGGWVLPLTVPSSTHDLLWSLDAETFAKACRGGGMDYEVTEEHRTAYTAFLAQHGLKAGELAMLKQAVYPLHAGAETLSALGIEVQGLQDDAKLLVLGWNND